MNPITKLLQDVPLPPMVKIVQRFDSTKLRDIEEDLHKQLRRAEIANTIRPGMHVTITCGSRGIANYPLVLRELAQFCRSKGATPIIVPAMGSHGGATAEGQRAVCEKMGVTETYCRCAIASDMQVIEIGRTRAGDPVYIDQNAAQSDGIIVANRIKSHTAFRGEYESGLMKMMVIGLGKQHGAHICHSKGYEHMANMIPLIGNLILQNAPILFGVGLLENAYHETSHIRVLTPQEIPAEEPKLLKVAKSMLPKLYCRQSDVLIVDWMGKNFSGAGMDSNITGRVHNPWAGKPRHSTSKLAVLDLSPQSGGNMHGVGAADVINRRIFEKANLETTYPNCITSTTLGVNKLPVMMANDMETIQCAIKTCNAESIKNARVIRIPNTLELSEILVSESLVDSLRVIPQVSITDETYQWRFNNKGNLW